MSPAHVVSTGCLVTESKSERRRLGRFMFRCLAVLAIASCLVGVGWAARTVFVPDVPQTAHEGATVKLVEGEVGSSISLVGLVNWQSEAVGVNRATGTVTRVNLVPGAEVHAGDPLYFVDLRPIIVAEGGVPAFRDLFRGVSGPDVLQLQALLSDLGYYSDEVDGAFGPVTRRAVMAWQRSLGIRPDGIVRTSDVIFVPELPIHLRLDPEVVSRGAILTGGESAVFALGEPELTVAAQGSAAAYAEVGTPVLVQAPGGDKWDAIVTGHRLDENHQTILVVGAPDGGAVCADTCDLLAPGESAQTLSVQVITVSSTSGIVVPTAALRADSKGAYLISATGEEIRVTVIATAHGMSVITGARLGTRVTVPTTS